MHDRSALRRCRSVVTSAGFGTRPPGDYLLTGASVVTGGSARVRDVVVGNDRILDVVEPGSGAGRQVVDVRGYHLTAGLIDIHVHGAVGHEFVEGDSGALQRITAELARHGVTSALATLGSEQIDTIVSALSSVASFQRSGFRAGAELLGVHLEGPYLSQEQRGAHPQSVVRDPTPREVEALLEHVGVLSMMTIAPERPGALDAIRAFADAGTVMSVGHSAAEPDDVRAARDAGASHFTHLWSGMSNLQRRGPWRHPGLIEIALSTTGMTAEIIADGRHLPAELMEIARRCFPGRLCLVSDAIGAAGLPEGTEFGPPDLRCRVEDGVAVVIGVDSFAGATTLLDGALRRVVLDRGWPLAEAVQMVTEVPARVIGVGEDRGSVAPGHRADLVVWDRQLNVRGTMLGGRWLDGFDAAASGCDGR